MKLIVSLHDVHPGSLDAVARQRADLRAAGVRRLSLLIVPLWHHREPIEQDPRFVETISQWVAEGDEAVLHGWTHSCAGLTERPRDWFWTRVYTQAEAEFRIAGVQEARIRIATGRALFERLGWPVVGFIAPAWLLAPQTCDVLRDLGFAYTTTRTGILPLQHRAAPIGSTSLCYSTRSGWRRVCSLLWNPPLARRQRRRPFLRISLHPGDVAHPAVWRQILRETRRGLQAGRLAVSYRDVAATAAHAPAYSA